MRENIIWGLTELDRATEFIKKGELYILCEKVIDYSTTILKSLSLRSEKYNYKPIYIDVYNIKDIEKVLNESEYDVALIDYYQGIDINSRYSNRNDELDYIARIIKRTARQKNVAVIMGVVEKINGTIRDTGACINVADTIIEINSIIENAPYFELMVLKKDGEIITPRKAGTYVRVYSNDYREAVIANTEIVTI